MCLAVLDCPSIALQSEMLLPSQETITALEARFKEVIVLYDNDFDKTRNAGQEMAEKICRTYGLTNLIIPSYYRSKDISDLVRDHGLEEAANVIQREENRDTSFKRESQECES
jgi:5S rRNA maturation endonuclease (ribonuclease M5)